MHPINPHILDRGADPTDIYPIAVGSQFLYLSADKNNIIGPDTLETDGATFYLGFNRADVT